MQKSSSVALILVLLIGHSIKADQPSSKYIRLSLAVLDHGDCYLKIEETSSPINSATKFQGESTKLDRLPNAEVLKATDGRYRIIHSFAPNDDLSKIFLTNNKAEVDSINGNLCFKSTKDMPAEATYWCRAKLPLIVCYDRLTIPPQSGLITLIDAKNLGMVGVNLLKTKDNKTFLGIFWFDRDSNNKPVNRTQLFGGEEIDPSKGFDHKFRLPVPNSVINDAFEIRFNASSNIPQKAEIAHLLVQGCPSPMIGIGFKEQSSVVFVEKIIPATVAEKSGLQTGDVILSINGREPKAVKDAVDACSQIALGETITFKIRRGEQDQEVKLVAE